MGYIYPIAEELEPLVEELGLEVESLERLAVYVGLVSWHSGTDEDAHLRENLAKWAEWEKESYYGWHPNPASFAQYYYENFVEHSDTNMPNWLAIDWQKTWDSNLRHDFYYDADSGHCWSEVY